MPRRPRKATIPPKELLPHFLNLVLQNQVATNEAIEEIITKQDEEVEKIYEDKGFKNLTTSVIDTGFEPVQKLDITIQGKLYLEKEQNRHATTFTSKPRSEDSITEQLHRRWSRTLWRRELNNLEPEYRLPVLILRKFKYIRDIEPTRLGPGTYDIEYFDIQKKKKLKFTRGIMHSCNDRFPKEKSADPMPGPGSYGYPYEAYEKATDHYKHPGRIPMLESGPCNIRSVMSIGNRNPGPGRYKHKSCMEELVEKRTSRKGPYDLYTPPRDIIPYGHHKTQVVTDTMGPGHYELRFPLTEELNNCCNYFKGKISDKDRVRKCTGERISLMAPLWPSRDTLNRPGPTDYTHEVSYKEPYQTQPPFKNSSLARPVYATDYDMSPDKYRPEIWSEKQHIVGDGRKSGFKSKTGRLDQVKVQLLTERLRGKDIPHFQLEQTRDGDPKDVSKMWCTRPPHKFTPNIGPF